LDGSSGPLDGTGTTERDARASGARPAPKVGEARQEDEEDVDEGSGSDSTRLGSISSILSLSRERERGLAGLPERQAITRFAHRRR